MVEISFGEWLKRQRRSVGLTQEQLATQIHCSTSALRKFEAELRLPSASIVEQLAEIFNIPQNERSSFLRFARGDWQAISGEQENAPWLAEKPKEIDLQKVGVDSSLPSGTVTFLFTDIEGSTKLAQLYPDAMPILLARHHEILRQAIQVHNGYIFQNDGDSLAVSFHSPMDALNAASKAQRLLQSEIWSPAPIKVRMGIHTGTAKLNDMSIPTIYTGYATLATAQRVMSAGHGGQILLSSATFELIRNSLPANTEFVDLGEKRLKDLLRLEHLYQFNITGLQTIFPPVKTLDEFRTNLPLQLTSFIGRERELAEIVDLLTKHRLVTLIGAGGIGKTRLSLEVAQAVLNTFSDGLWFIELAPLSDPAIVLQTIVNALGLLELANRPSQTVLIDFLKAKNSLLILDNCEHIIQACAELTETLLQTCPKLHLVATSRETLGVSGEFTFSVAPLSAPDFQKPITTESITEYEAVELFLERAQTAVHDFALTPDNTLAVAQICRHLDGIPLALELAAARLKGLSVQQIAALLDDRFRLLTSGARTVLPRHQTLHALIDWSHALLADPERILFRRLAIFAGGWTLEAAEQVCADDGIKSNQILDLLLHLVEKSLVVAETQAAETRYQMLETIRQYAREKLWAAGEGELLRQQHLAYFVDLAERAEPNLRAFDMVTWLDRLEAEVDDIRVALEHALESDIEAGLRLASALLWFWHIRGPRREGSEWLERGLSIEAQERGAHGLTPGRAMIRGNALNASGWLLGMSLEFGKAPIRLEESRRLFEKYDTLSKRGLAYALLGLARLPSLGNRASTLLEQSHTLFRQLEDKFGMAECLMFLMGRAYENGDYEQAIRFAEEQLAVRKEIGDQDGIASALVLLGEKTFFWEDDLPRALKLMDQGLTLFHAIRNKWAIGYWNPRYGEIFLWHGDFERAATIYEKGLAFARDVGDIYLTAYNVHSLGVVAWFQGDYAHAAQMVTESLASFREVGHHWLIASSLHALGDIALAQNDPELATQSYEAEQVVGHNAQVELRAFAVIGLGKVAWVRGDYDLATKRFEEGLRIGRETRFKQAMFHALYGLGRVSQSQANYNLARSFYTETLNVLRQRFNIPFATNNLITYVAPVAYPLAAIALLANMQNEMSRAACLLGAVEALYTPLRFAISAKERAEHDKAIAAARAALGEEEFITAWEEGKKMSLDEAIAFALKESKT